MSEGWSLLRERRREMDVRTREMSCRVGVYMSTIHAWESGRQMPHVSKLRGIADGYELPIEQVVAMWYESRTGRRLKIKPVSGIDAYTLRHWATAEYDSTRAIAKAGDVEPYVVYRWLTGEYMPEDMRPLVCAFGRSEEEILMACYSAWEGWHNK